MTKILILRFSSIGDIVLTTPVIRAVKTQLPDAVVHFCTKKEYEFLLTENPYLDKIHTLDDNLTHLVKQLKAEQYDFILDLHHNLRTFFIRNVLRTEAGIVDKLNVKKWLMTNFKIDLLPKRHIVDRYMDAVAPLGVTTDDLGLDYYIPHKDHVEMEWLPRAYQHGFVALVIGAKYATKRLPQDRIIELCDRINKPIVLLGGSAEAATGEAVEAFFKRHTTPDQYTEGLKQLGKDAIVFNACGKFNFNQSASMVKQARWVFTHDTGLMHVAAAFKKEIFSIWGSTIPDFGMYPYRTKFTIFENKKLSCRPCSKLGFGQCPKGHFKCMKEVTFDFYLPD